MSWWGGGETRRKRTNEGAVSPTTERGQWLMPFPGSQADTGFTRRCLHPWETCLYSSSCGHLAVQRGHGRACIYVCAFAQACTCVGGVHMGTGCCMCVLRVHAVCMLSAHACCACTHVPTWVLVHFPRTFSATFPLSFGLLETPQPLAWGPSCPFEASALRWAPPAAISVALAWDPSSSLRRPRFSGPAWVITLF